MHKLTSLCLLGLALGLVGCSSHPLSQGRKFNLVEADFSDLSGWEIDDFVEARPALLNSCAQNTDKRLIDFCATLAADEEMDSDEIRVLIEETFQPYLVVVDGSSKGVITGYYEAELSGTRERENSAQVPIYAQPWDYQKDKKYKMRQDIEKHGIHAPIIAWADDPVELFILHVQGSGRMMTPDGEIRLGYAGNNGRTFKGLGAILAEEGLLSETGHSMPDIKQWLQKHPDVAVRLMRENPRYIFFKEVEGETPYGTAGVVLTPMRSVAVDKQFIPMHTFMWLETQTPDKSDLNRLVVAQDTGNAIKGGVRADFFWGHGEDAFDNAGRMKSMGRYYLLLPKD